MRTSDTKQMTLNVEAAQRVTVYDLLQKLNESGFDIQRGMMIYLTETELVVTGPPRWAGKPEMVKESQVQEEIDKAVAVAETNGKPATTAIITSASLPPTDEQARGVERKLRRG